MRGEPEVQDWLTGGGLPLHVIGQRMIERAQHEPACSYRWCIHDVGCGTRYAFNEHARAPASSTRKLYILVAVLLLIERGELTLSDSVVVNNQKAGIQTCGGLWLLDSPQALTADHPLSAVNTPTASDLVTALSILVEGANNRLPIGGAFIRRELCEFGLNSMRAQQDTTAIRSWLTDAVQVGDKHGIGYRNYNNVAYLAHGGAVRIVFSIIVDDLHRIESPMPAFAHARDFIALFSRLLDDYVRLEYPSKEL